MDQAKFFKAVCEGNEILVREFLAASPELVSSREDGATPLHFAALHNHQTIVDLLVGAGADLNARDDEYQSAPIGWANEIGHSEMVAYLYRLGASVDLHRASAFGLTERISELLDEDTSSINAISGYGAPIHEAALWGHPEIVSLLLSKGADPRLVNSDGETAMMIASRQVAENCPLTTIVIESRRAEIQRGCQKVVEILSEAA